MKSGALIGGAGGAAAGAIYNKTKAAEPKTLNSLSKFPFHQSCLHRSKWLQSWGFWVFRGRSFGQRVDVDVSEVSDKDPKFRTEGRAGGARSERQEKKREGRSEGKRRRGGKEERRKGLGGPNFHRCHNLLLPHIVMEVFLPSLLSPVSIGRLLFPKTARTFQPDYI